jgi:hypothetical protein
MSDKAAQPEMAPATELEITPQMIAAGFQVLMASGAVENPNSDLDRDLVRKIYLVMQQVSQS